MPRPDKAQRRDKKREKEMMPISGRGLISDTPNWDRRREKEKSMRKRRNKGKRT